MTNEITNEELARLKALAEAASPGPWKGDRYDGTVKYNLLSAEDQKVISGDNGNSDHGPFGIHEEEDEKYLLAAHPAAILALIAKVESLAADAERWQFLKKHHESEEPCTFCVFFDTEDHSSLEPVGSLPNELDEEIDAAMAKEKA